MLMMQERTQKECKRDRVRKEMGRTEEDGMGMERGVMFTQRMSEETYIATWILGNIWGQNLYIQERKDIMCFTSSFVI